MKIKDLIKELKEFDGEAEVYIASDEELNSVFRDIDYSEYRLSEDDEKTRVVLWGNSGSEVEYE